MIDDSFTSRFNLKKFVVEYFSFSWDFPTKKTQKSKGVTHSLFFFSLKNYLFSFFSFSLFLSSLQEERRRVMSGRVFHHKQVVNDRRRIRNHGYNVSDLNRLPYERPSVRRKEAAALKRLRETDQQKEDRIEFYKDPKGYSCREFTTEEFKRNQHLQGDIQAVRKEHNYARVYT